MQRSIKIRVLKENTSKVTIHLVSANRKMVVPKEKFLQHVKSGLYDIVNEHNVDLTDNSPTSS